MALSLSSTTPIDQPVSESLPLSTAELSLEESYEIESTCCQIAQGGFKKVALQFPDELLHDAVPVFQSLRQRLPIELELYILADTTYGSFTIISCCVDEVAAEHVNADLMVHYGHACMSSTVRLPVIYVFGKKHIDSTEAALRLSEEINKSTATHKAALLFYDVAYEWRAARLKDELQETLKGTVVIQSTIDRSPGLRRGKARAKVVGNGDLCHCSSDAGCSMSAHSLDSKVPVKSSAELSNDCILIYIGEESLSLINLLMTHPQIPVYSYSPLDQNARLESNKTNRMLMRRYAVTQKARDADVFGIVVGTLGVASYLPIISRLRALLRKHHRKAYTLAVGKLNPAKLANYQEVECFVLVACGENSLVEGAKDFHRPIVTPFELEVALGERPWTGSEYVLDFGKLLSKTARSPDESIGGQSSDEEDTPVFSAVTGKYRTRKRFGDTVLDPQLGVLAQREGGRAVAEAIGSAAGMHLADRTYGGLNPRFGQDAPALVEQGRHGLARGYEDDHS